MRIKYKITEVQSALLGKIKQERNYSSWGYVEMSTRLLYSIVSVTF